MSMINEYLKLLILSLVLVLAWVYGYTQIPDKRYFKNLSGSVWIAPGNSNEEAIMKENEFGLILWENPIDSIKVNSTLWLFSDSLLI